MCYKRKKQTKTDQTAKIAIPKPTKLLKHPLPKPTKLLKTTTKTDDSFFCRFIFLYLWSNT